MLINNIPFLLTLVLLLSLEPQQTSPSPPPPNRNKALHIFNRKKSLHVKVAEAITVLELQAIVATNN